MVIPVLACLHVVSHDFSDEFPCSGICVIHKISVNVYQKMQELLDCAIKGVLKFKVESHLQEFSVTLQYNFIEIKATKVMHGN